MTLGEFCGRKAWLFVFTTLEIDGRNLIAANDPTIQMMTTSHLNWTEKRPIFVNILFKRGYLRERRGANGYKRVVGGRSLDWLYVSVFMVGVVVRSSFTLSFDGFKEKFKVTQERLRPFWPQHCQALL